MDNYLKKFKEFCSIYVDDILVFSKDVPTHYEHLALVLKECKRQGIVLSECKAKLCLHKINFLGLEIEEGKIKLQSHVLDNIQNFPSKIENKVALQ